MQIPSLTHLSNAELGETLKNLRNRERDAIAEIVLHLSEVDSRGMYRNLGYSSLFSYCRECLGYSEGGAYRRIQAARCLKTNPEVYTKLKEGALTLCAIAEVSKVKASQEKEELLIASEGKSKGEVKALVINHLPPSKAKQVTATVAVKRVVVETPPIFSVPTQELIKTEERYTIKLEVDSSFMKLFNEARSFCGGTTEDLFRKALQGYCDKRSPIRRAKRREEKALKTKQSSSTNPRHIPLVTRDQIFIQNEGRCSYIGSSGVRCSSTRCLQIDHIHPVGKGGTSHPSNLRLLCPEHNRHAAERQFGREFTRQFVPKTML